jgi:transposase
MSETASPAWHKWRDLIERQRASGLSVAVFCRRDGVAASSFFAWKRKLGSTPPTAAFVEATVAGTPPTPSPPLTRPAGRIEVRLRGGRRVRVGRGFDRGLLAEVVAALEGLS